MTLVAMFPGQSSRYPEMLSKLGTNLEPYSAILGRDLRTLDLSTNRDVQVGVFLANHLHLELLTAAGITFAWSIGLSLGEYNHLVHIGAIAFADALRLVDARGRLYDEARGGLMVSVFPLQAELVELAIAKLGLGDRVAVGLYNSPRQQVISGEREAVEAVITELERDEYFDATVIEPRIPMHAPCFVATAAKLAEILATVSFVVPQAPYVPNVVGRLIAAPSPDQIRTHLAAHVHRPVRWQACVDDIAARVPEPQFVEVGPRAVLHNLFGKDWMPGKRAKTDVAEGWPQHFADLVGELRHGDQQRGGPRHGA